MTVQSGCVQCYIEVMEIISTRVLLIIDIYVHVLAVVVYKTHVLLPLLIYLCSLLPKGSPSGSKRS